MKFWSPCHVLFSACLSFHQYCTVLTTLAKEVLKSNRLIPHFTFSFKIVPVLLSFYVNVGITLSVSARKSCQEFGRNSVKAILSQHLCCGVSQPINGPGLVCLYLLGILCLLESHVSCVFLVRDYKWYHIFISVSAWWLLVCVSTTGFVYL